MHVYVCAHVCADTSDLPPPPPLPEMEFFAVVDAGNQTVCLTTKPFLQPHPFFLKGRLLEDFGVDCYVCCDALRRELCCVCY